MHLVTMVREKLKGIKIRGLRGLKGQVLACGSGAVHGYALDRMDRIGG